MNNFIIRIQIRCQIKEDGMGGECTLRENDKCVQSFGKEARRKEDTLEM
jgi:hypothetical protein